MSDYEYADLDGVRMNIDGYTTNVNVYLTDRRNTVSTIIPVMHAPAIALAILEAAGYGKTEAAGFVRGQVDALVKQADRESKDVKVRAWHHALWPHAYGVTGKVNDRMRAEYETARKFFEEEE